MTQNSNSLTSNSSLIDSSETTDTKPKQNTEEGNHTDHKSTSSPVRLILQKQVSIKEYRRRKEEMIRRDSNLQTSISVSDDDEALSDLHQRQTMTSTSRSRIGEESNNKAGEISQRIPTTISNRSHDSNKGDGKVSEHQDDSLYSKINNINMTEDNREEFSSKGDKDNQPLQRNSNINTEEDRGRLSSSSSPSLSDGASNSNRASDEDDDDDDDGRRRGGKTVVRNKRYTHSKRDLTGHHKNYKSQRNNNNKTDNTDKPTTKSTKSTNSPFDKETVESSSSSDYSSDVEITRSGGERVTLKFERLRQINARLKNNEESELFDTVATTTTTNTTTNSLTTSSTIEERTATITDICPTTTTTTTSKSPASSQQTSTSSTIGNRTGNHENNEHTSASTNLCNVEINTIKQQDFSNMTTHNPKTDSTKITAHVINSTQSVYSSNYNNRRPSRELYATRTWYSTGDSVKKQTERRRQFARRGFRSLDELH